MGERMTDESLAYQRQKIEVEDGAYAWLSISAELDRARASEHEKTLENARLLNEREEMGRTIKALADALWDHGDVYGGDGWHRYGCPLADMHGGSCGERCQKDRAALRLAGRL